jgi:hypothetical protein
MIYLRTEHDPKKMVELLLTERLIASASIDMNNISYKMKNGIICEEIYNVITAQSKAQLFSTIVDVAEKEIGESISINSVPIVGANGFFNETVVNLTKSISL